MMFKQKAPYLSADVIFVSVCCPKRRPRVGRAAWAGHGSDGAFFLAVSLAHDNYYSDAQWWAGAWPGLASSRDILITLILL